MLNNPQPHEIFAVDVAICAKRAKVERRSAVEAAPARLTDAWIDMEGPSPREGEHIDALQEVHSGNINAAPCPLRTRRARHFDRGRRVDFQHQRAGFVRRREDEQLRSSFNLNLRGWCLIGEQNKQT